MMSDKMNVFIVGMQLLKSVYLISLASYLPYSHNARECSGGTCHFFCVNQEFMEFVPRYGTIGVSLFLQFYCRLELFLCK